MGEFPPQLVTPNPTRPSNTREVNQSVHLKVSCNAFLLVIVSRVRCQVKNFAIFHLLFTIFCVGVTGKHLCLARFIKGNYLKRLRGSALHFHAGGAGRHTRYGQPNNVGPFGQEPPNFGYRHMPFHHIAIYDGRMASLELRRYLITDFDRCQVLSIFYLDGKAVFFDILAPAATAASGGGFVNGYLR